jgi:AraC-like DNA-binding protein
MTQMDGFNNRESWIEMGMKSRYRARNLAQGSGVSLRQLQRYFQILFGKTPQEWLNEQRMIAAGPLVLGSESVKRAAFDLGFKQPAHFCRHFKRHYGVPPSQFVRDAQAQRSGETLAAQADGL